MTFYNIIPVSTYRLQFNSNFTFKKGEELVDYLHELGITHCYSSPLQKARKGSVHGYDIIDHTQINPEIGTREEFVEWVKELRRKNMGLIVDIIPNHMFIMDVFNQWWNDILENGLSSPFADYFDIDWHPPRIELQNKVLLPLLESQYGETLENELLKIVFQDGAFYVKLTSHILTTDPCSWVHILESIVEVGRKVLSEDDVYLVELMSVITAVKHLPQTTEVNPEKVEERHREKEVIKRRLATLMVESKILEQQLQKQLQILNGKKGDASSFNELEQFLKEQVYRLSYWRVANEEINYRRFFDVFDLAGIKTEKREVFEAVHALILELIKEGNIDGLRIDHIDGLRDPKEYLENLQSYVRKYYKENSSDLFYIVAEKILIGNEKLRSEWPLCGTVGYDFLNQLNGLYVVQSNAKALKDIYRNFTDITINPFDLAYSCKKLILVVSMSSELYVLSRHLDRISEQHRSSRDFTAEGLRIALREVISCFSVYRSYIQPYQGKISEEDQRYVLNAIFRAKRLNPAINESIFEFIQNVLLSKHQEGISEEQTNERNDFVMRFQQLTGPVMAKGIEDTAFYRYYPLCSLNEVGTDLSSFGVSIDAFHNKNIQKFETWPYTLTTTSTHDTKRSEDVRARINVLSEIPEEWGVALARWSQLNKQHKVIDGDEQIPNANEEYLLYQILLGTWPFNPLNSEEFQEYIKRIQAYMEKATKEAKIHTSWISPNKNYDDAVKLFVAKIMDHNSSGAQSRFLQEFQDFFSKIAAAGMLNSLSQVILKMTSPGIPDIYQGNEIWDFSLVDPDNRRQLDFSYRKELLKSVKKISGSQIDSLLKEPGDGRVKMFMTFRSLRLRLKFPEVFVKGNYIHLEVEGELSNHVIAFARILKGKTIVVIATRFFANLVQNLPVIEPKFWSNTYVSLPSEMKFKAFQNHLNDQQLVLDQNKINLEKAFGYFPFSLLESDEEIHE